MAALTLSTMRTAVRTRLGNPSTDGFFTDAQLTDMVNEALQVVSSEHNWPWQQATETIATVSGTGTYTPASGSWVATQALTINGSNSMSLKTLKEIREWDTTITGEPVEYCVDNELLVLRPVPGQVYSVVHDYFKLEPELTGDSDTPLVPAQFRWAIVEFATYLAHLRQGDNDRAARALDAYNLWIQKMRNFSRRTTSTHHVRVRPGTML